MTHWQWCDFQQRFSGVSMCTLTSHEVAKALLGGNVTRLDSFTYSLLGFSFAVSSHFPYQMVLITARMLFQFYIWNDTAILKWELLWIVLDKYLVKNNNNIFFFHSTISKPKVTLQMWGTRKKHQCKKTCFYIRMNFDNASITHCYLWDTSGGRINLSWIKKYE